MKKILSLILVTVFCGLGLTVRANDVVTLVSGHVTKTNARSIILFEVIEGKKIEYATTKLDLNNDFAFAIQSVKKGFYYLADQNKKEYTRIYLQPGEQLQIKLNENGEYDIVRGSAQNKLLHDWFTTSYVITNPSFNWMKDTSTYTTFFPKLNAFLPEVPVFKKRINTKDKYFNELLGMTVDMDVEHAAMYFLMTPNTIHPKREDYPAFYETILTPNKYSSAKLLQLGEGVDILGRYSNLNFLMNRNKEKPTNRLLETVNLFGNDTLKGAYIASALYPYKSYETLTRDIEPVKKYLVTDSMQAVYFRALKAVSTFKKGSPAFNFVYENTEGKKVSMNDMKGKVIVLDVWATWCGPCKAELPSLKVLENEMKGRNVEFVSISVDVEKDKEKWKNFIEKEKLGGTQLFASGWSDVTKFYDISGIPRFMVFDQEGKIVNVDAPRPSTPDLKLLVEETLQGK